MLGRTLHEADLQRQRRHACLDEAVLITADEGVALGLRIRQHLERQRTGDALQVFGEVRFFQPLDHQALQRKERQEHVGVEVGDNLSAGDRRTVREIARPQQAFLLGGHGDKHDRPLRCTRSRGGRSRLDQRGNARRVVHGAVVDAVTANRLAYPHMVDVCGYRDVLIPEGRIAAAQHPHDVVGLDRLGINRHLDSRRRGNREPRQHLAVGRQRQQFLEGVAGAIEEPFGSSGVDGYRRLLAECLIERWIGNRHRRHEPRQLRSVPRDVLALRVLDREDADGAGLLQVLPANRLIVRQQRSGNV